MLQVYLILPLACSLSHDSSSGQQVDGTAPGGKEFITTAPSITTETISTTMVSKTQEVFLSDQRPCPPKQPDNKPTPPAAVGSPHLPSCVGPGT